MNATGRGNWNQGLQRQMAEIEKIHFQEHRDKNCPSCKEETCGFFRWPIIFKGANGVLQLLGSDHFQACKISIRIKDSSIRSEAPPLDFQIQGLRKSPFARRKRLPGYPSRLLKTFCYGQECQMT
ncbi:MAG: hypothetical protein GX444_03840 [Myxococcales bacterium]|nr:hypothetical protein [Myxococcales bacterium]